MVDRIGPNYSTRILFGFIAGFAATLVFHQLTLWVLWGVGLGDSLPFRRPPQNLLDCRL